MVKDLKIIAIIVIIALPSVSFGNTIKISDIENYLNSITGVTINLFNGIFLYLTSLSINNTKIQILFLFGGMFVYLMSYFILFKSKIYLEK